MRVLVVYYSETKNTEKVANAIYNEVSKKNKAFLRKVEDITADRLNDYDLVFLGSACHGGDLALPVKTLLNAIPRPPKFKLAGFFTHSCPTQEHLESFNRWASKCVTSFEEVSKEKAIDFRGYYNCRGAPSPPIQEFIRKAAFRSDDIADKYIKDALKHPSPEDLRSAEEFARKMTSNLA